MPSGPVFKDFVHVIRAPVDRSAGEQYTMTMDAPITQLNMLFLAVFGVSSVELDHLRYETGSVPNGEGNYWNAISFSTLKLSLPDKPATMYRLESQTPVGFRMYTGPIFAEGTKMKLFGKFTYIDVHWTIGELTHQMTDMGEIVLRDVITSLKNKTPPITRVTFTSRIDTSNLLCWTEQRGTLPGK